MVAKCVYCQQFIAQREPFADTRITHGACDICLTHLLDEIQQALSESHAPFGVISRDARILDLPARRSTLEPVCGGT